MRLATQAAQHQLGFFCIGRLTQNLLVEHHDGIGRDKHLIVAHLIGRSLLLGYIFSNLARREGVGIALVDVIDDANLERNVEACQEFFASG